MSDYDLRLDLRQEISDVHADPDFVCFLMAWNGLVCTEKVPFMREKYSEAYQKAVKRKIEKSVGDDWKSDWKDIQEECLKPRRDWVLLRTLFRMEPLPPNPSHRPRNLSLWRTVFDLRNYFRAVTGKPNMNLVRHILVPHEQEYAVFNAEWQKRRNWFDEIEGPVELARLQKFYGANRRKVMDALKTGAPLYAQFESEHGKQIEARGNTPDVELGISASPHDSIHRSVIGIRFRF